MEKKKYDVAFSETFDGYTNNAQQMTIDEIYDAALKLQAEETLHIYDFGVCGVDVAICKDGDFLKHGESYEDYCERMLETGEEMDNLPSKEDFEKGDVSLYNSVTFTIEGVGSSDCVHMLDSAWNFLSSIENGTIAVDLNEHWINLFGDNETQFEHEPLSKFLKRGEKDGMEMG